LLDPVEHARTEVEPERLKTRGRIAGDRGLADQEGAVGVLGTKSWA
jgi:hypothetical protein